MASSYTVADLLTNIAAITGSATFTASTRVTSTQVTYWLSQAVRSWSALMRQKFPEDRELIQTATLTTTAGLSLVSLPADCGEVHSVVWQRGTNDYVLLESAQQGDLAWRLDTGDTWEGACIEPRYRLAGQTLEVFPPGNSAETLEVYYTSHLSSGGATVIAKIDFDRWVEYDVAALVCTAKSQTARAAEFKQSKALLENDLLSRARQRDVNKVNTIRDTKAERLLSHWRRNWH